jgi:hypothetical protein
MSGAILLLSLYAFMAWTGTILTFAIIVPVVFGSDVLQYKYRKENGLIYNLIFPGQSGRSLNLTAHLHPAPRLRMGGAIPLTYAFMT